MAVITPADWTSKQPITPIQVGHIFRTVELTAAQLVHDNFIKMAKLPAGYRIVDLILESDDLDTGSPAITLAVGILNSDENGLVSGTTMISGSTIAQGGGLARIASQSLEAIGSSTSERTVAVQITDAPATAAAGGLTISMLIAPA